MEYRIGEIVIYRYEDDKPYYYYGLITRINGDEVSLLRVTRHSITKESKKILKGNLTKRSEAAKCIEFINDYYNNKIIEKKNQLKSVRRSDYQAEIDDKYLKLKNEIINTAKNLILCDNDSEFENKLKAICQKKKNLFSIECDETRAARKFNGAILHDIKDLEKSRDSIMKNLNDDFVEIKLGFK